MPNAMPAISTTQDGGITGGIDCTISETPVNQALLWSLQIDCTWCMSSSPVNCMGVPIQLTGRLLIEPRPVI